MTTPDDDLENPNGDDLETTTEGSQSDDLESPETSDAPEQPAAGEGAQSDSGPDPFDDDDDEDWGEPNEPEQPPAPPAPPEQPPAPRAAPAQAGPQKNTTCLVRIRKPKTGSKARSVKRYTVKHNGVGHRFRVDHGWYEVPIELGRKLREVRVNNLNEDSPRVFDVQNIKNAAKIEEEEQLAHQKSAEKPATDPRSATTD